MELTEAWFIYCMFVVLELVEYPFMPRILSRYSKVQESSSVALGERSCRRENREN